MRGFDFKQKCNKIIQKILSIPVYEKPDNLMENFCKHIDDKKHW